MGIAFHDFCKLHSRLMPKRSRKKANRKKNPAAVALSKLGASKGGKARAAKLSAKERSRIATLAVNTRWKKHQRAK
jgi:hypothetical protein